MLILVVKNSAAASGNIFSCVSDRAVTLDGMATPRAQAAGLPVEIVRPKAVGIDHFYAQPRAAKTVLGWHGTTDLLVDLEERFDEYVKIGRDKKPVQFEIDDTILDSSH